MAKTRKKVNQSRRTQYEKGVYPPSEHEHHDLDDRIVDLEYGYITVTDATENYTILESDNIILCTGTFTIALMSAVGLDGKTMHIKNIGTGVITVDGASKETIDDELTQKIYQYDNMMIISDNVEWWII